MQGLWINVECLKCGNKNEKKYFLDTLDKLNRFFKIKCSCGNNECEHFRLIEMDVSKGFES